MSIYGNIKNGGYRLAPKMLIIDNKEVWYPSDEQYEEHGYKLTVLSDIPAAEQGYHAECQWQESENTITQNWVIVADSDDSTAEEILSIILGGAE